MSRLILLAFACLCSTYLYAANIYIVQSYHAEYEWDAEYIQSLQDNLGPDHRYVVRALDSKRQKPEQWQQTAAKVVEEILTVIPDLVIVGDDNAMKSVGSVLNGSEIPVVFLGVNGTLEQYGLIGSENVTGVLERPFFEQSVRHLRKVIDKRERFLVLMDDSVTMQNAVSDTYGSERRVNIQNTQIDFLLTNSAEQWQDAVKSAQTDYDAIIVGTYHTLRYANDTYFDPGDAMGFLRTHSSIPVFSFWNIFIGSDKAIGGYAITAYEEGKAAARMAQLVLRGISISSIPPVASLAGQYVYSESGLQKWDVSLTALTRSQTLFVD